MRLSHLVHVVGLILVAVSGALAVSGGVGLVYGDGDAGALFAAAALSATAGWIAYRRTSLDRDLSVREGYAVVSAAWLAVGVAGAVPYLLTGVVESPAAALFESVSGFTTTGATVFAEIEALPHGIHFWRCLTQWLGGMGIIVLGVAILPFLGIGGMQLFRAEVPGPMPERLAPRITQTAKLLWYVYAVLTAAEVVLLLVAGLPLFEAVTHAFTTLSTGGFSPRNASIAAYDSAWVQYVIVLFMYLAGVNFTLHFRAAAGRPVYGRDPEWRFFTAVVAGATAVVFALTWSGPGAGGWTGLERTFREALFQVVSIGTTTGYVTTDYEAWTTAGQLLLLGLMFMGGMAGSTAGGMKAMRVYILFRHGMAELKRSLHPRALVPTRLGERPVGEGVLQRILAFALFYIVLHVAGVFVMALLGHDLVTSIGASAATIGNIGPGIGDVGAVDNYGWMGPASHLALVFLMLAGRLEIFTVLLLFHPDLWRRHGR